MYGFIFKVMDEVSALRGRIRSSKFTLDNLKICSANGRKRSDDRFVDSQWENGIHYFSGIGTIIFGPIFFIEFQ